jgi:hypothetical protein
MGSRILNSLSYTGEDSSYSLRFRVPQYRCNQSTSHELYIESTNRTLYYQVLAFNLRWSRIKNDLTFQKYTVDDVYAPFPGLNEV